MVRTRESVVVAALLAAFIISGCASERSGRGSFFPVDVELTSEPAGAKIIARVAMGNQPGTLKVVALTPHTLTIPAPITVVLHKRGFAPVMVSLGIEGLVSVPLERLDNGPPDATLRSTSLRSTSEEIWREGTFQGEKISFADDGLRRRAYISDNPELPVGVKEAVAAGKLVHGMTPEQVLAAWGRPQGVISSEDNRGRHDKWLYGKSELAERFPREIFFENGRVTSWRE